MSADASKQDVNKTGVADHKQSSSGTCNVIFPALSESVQRTTPNHGAQKNILRPPLSSSTLIAPAECDENLLLKEDPASGYTHVAEELQNDQLLIMEITLHENGDKEELLLSANGHVPIIAPFQLIPPAPVMQLEVAIREEPFQQRAFIGVECNHAVPAHDAAQPEIVCRHCGQRI